MKKLLIGLVLIVSSCAYGQTVNQYGSPAGTYCAGGPQTIADISTTPASLYVCAGADAHTWTSAGGGGGTVNPVTSGLLAEYQFQPGETGNQSLDYTKNNNTCVWSASPHAPTRGTYGELKLGYSTTGNYCDTGIPANTAVTIISYISYIAPATSTLASGFISDSTGTVFLFNSYNGKNNTGIFNTRSSANSYDGMPGYGAVAWTRSASLDNIYVNGALNMQLTGGSLSLTTGTLYIGASLTGCVGACSPVNVSVHWTDVYSGTLTQQQIQAVGAWQAQQVAAKGYSFTPQNSNSIIECDGDSITFGFGAQPFCGSLALNISPTYFNSGIPGEFMAQMVLGQPRVNALYPTNGQQTPLIIFGGTNDLSGQSANATIVATTAANLSTYIRNAVAQGWKVFPVTTLSRATADDVHRDQYNTLIRSNWKAWGASGLIDMAANANIGADGASANSTGTACAVGGAWFQSDHVHPITCAQTGIMATMASNAINYFYGATKSAPTVITATTYTVTAADAYILWTPTAAATGTLLDCTGMTGDTFTIENGSPTYDITMSTSASQTLVGSGVVAKGTSKTFTCNLTGASTGGNYWTAF